MYVFDAGSFFYVVSPGMPTDPVEFGMGETLRDAVTSLSPTPQQSAGRWSVERAAGIVAAYDDVDEDDVVDWYTEEYDYDVADILEESEAHKLYGDAMDPDMADHLLRDVVEAVEAAFPGFEHRLRVTVYHLPQHGGAPILEVTAVYPEGELSDDAWIEFAESDAWEAPAGFRVLDSGPVERTLVYWSDKPVSGVYVQYVPIPDHPALF